MKRVDFNEEIHEYSMEGIKLPSVTQLIAPLGKDYHNLDEYEELAIDKAAERGTILHKFVSNLLLDWNYEGLILDIPDDYMRLAMLVNDFMENNIIIPLTSEVPLGSVKLGFAGTPDLLCYFNGQLTLMDFKFVSKIAKTKTKAQLNAYNLLYNEQGVYPDALCAVHFMLDKYKLYYVPFDTTEFDICNALHYHKNRKHKSGEIE